MINTELIKQGNKIKVILDNGETFEGEVYKRYARNFVLKTTDDKFCIIDEIQIESVEGYK